MPGSECTPLIAHIVYRFDVGGLENGIVNLINHLPVDRFGHVIICLTDYSEAFHRRIRAQPVTIYSLHKRDGQDWGLFRRLASLLRELRPQVVHTRNLATLECQWIARWCRVPVRIHGEHGWDVSDLDGSNRKYLWLRRLVFPSVDRVVSLSRHTEEYLVRRVGLARHKSMQIYNGVDTRKFHPASEVSKNALPKSLRSRFVIGTVGRLSAVKNQALLLRAFARLCATGDQQLLPLALVLIGDGPCSESLQQLADQMGIADRIWFAGSRNDIPQLLQCMDLFVLPSLAEGICNTLMEAMACGVPVVATDVGGNGEIVEHGRTGELVESDNDVVLAGAMKRLLLAPELRRQYCRQARNEMAENFSLVRMVAVYEQLYQRLLTARLR